jgi:gas vesicle protein
MDMRRSASWGIATLLTAGLAAGCSQTGSTPGSTTHQAGAIGGAVGAATSSTPAPAPTTSTSTPPPRMSVDDFKKRLQGINGVLAPDYDALSKAKTTNDITTALDKLSKDAQSQVGQLPDNPPENVDSATTEFADALKDLGSSADDEKQDAGSKVCAGSSAAAALSRSSAADHVRSAAGRLAAGDPAYTNILTFMPGPVQDQNRRLATGAVLRRSSGPGKLTVHTADQDAVITLTHVGSKTPVTSVYVRANSTTDLNEVPAATFDAYIAYGTDWDDAAHAFTRDCAFSKTDQTFDFSNNDWELTLYKVANGNMQEIPVDPNQAPPP